MNFSRLSLVLRLPLAVFLCSQLVFLSGDFPLGDYYASSAEEVVAFNEHEDTQPFDAGLSVAIFEDALIQPSGKVLSLLGTVSLDTTLDLRATGPPTV